MKTSKLILALSLILIFATGFNTLYAQKNLSSDLPEKSKAQKVCYVVRIENFFIQYLFQQNL
jgi:TolB-like protein